MNGIVLIVLAALVLLGLIFWFLVLFSLKRKRYFQSFASLLAGLVFILSAALVTVIAAGMKGYQALTREDLAALIYITPLGNQHFQARIVRPNACDTTLFIAGDELYIDARIIKWKPFANLVGIHTYYCLDRVGGRYHDIRDETTKVRTLYSLAGPMRLWDIFSLVKNFAFLAPFLDTQYGSAAFTSPEKESVLRVKVSTSGLLIRTGTD